MYVMPSRKEGFGIVFIEAMYYGLPVVSGQFRWLTDALLNGEWVTRRSRRCERNSYGHSKRYRKQSIMPSFKKTVDATF